MKFWASLFLLNDEKSHKRSKSKLFALKTFGGPKIRTFGTQLVRDEFESRFFRRWFLNKSEFFLMKARKSSREKYL